MTLKQSDIEALLQLFGESDWEEMRLKYGDDELLFSKDPAATGPAASTTLAPAAAPHAQGTPTPATEPSSATAPSAATTEPDRGNWVAVTTPNLGTFYRAPSPDEEPYVTENTKVNEDTEICLVEVMKLFTTIRAGVAGTIREIAAEDGALVEFGETLMWIEPEG